MYSRIQYFCILGPGKGCCLENFERDRHSKSKPLRRQETGLLSAQPIILLSCSFF